MKRPRARMRVADAITMAESAHPLARGSTGESAPFKQWYIIGRCHGALYARVVYGDERGLRVFATGPLEALRQVEDRHLVFVRSSPERKVIFPDERK